jgi:hypothetical protein
MSCRLETSLLSLLPVILCLASFGHAQKGIDTQTQKIKEDSNKTTTRQGGDPARSFDWGKGKTHVRDRLPNPYKLNSRRDVLVETIMQVLKERKMIVDEASSRLSDGIIITQPYVFSKGPVITQNELNRYAVLSFADTAWSRGQYTLTIEVRAPWTANAAERARTSLTKLAAVLSGLVPVATVGSWTHRCRSSRCPSVRSSTRPKI